jgi:hypothetical protein
VATYGDPLMTCPSPLQPIRERIELERQWSEGDVRLRAETASMLRSWQEDREDMDALAKAIRNLVLLGEDEHAATLFRAAAAEADARGVDIAVARAALGALFRRADRDGFLVAWSSAGLTDDRSRTMLWHIMGPNLSHGLDEDAVVQLQANLREPRVDIDLGRLRPALERVFGRDHVAAMIGRLIQETRHDRTKRELERMR